MGTILSMSFFTMAILDNGKLEPWGFPNWIAPPWCCHPCLGGAPKANVFHQNWFLSNQVNKLVRKVRPWSFTTGFFERRRLLLFFFSTLAILGGKKDDELSRVGKKIYSWLESLDSMTPFPLSSKLLLLLLLESIVGHLSLTCPTIAPPLIIFFREREREK